MQVSVEEKCRQTRVASNPCFGRTPLCYQVPIHQWDEADRPREKLMRRGPSALSDAELIALIFGSGTHTKQGSISAVQLVQALLQAYGSLYALAQRDLRELTRVAGVGPAKAVQLVAAFEIGRRVEAQRPGRRIQVRTPADVAACYGPLLRDLKREVFKIVLLNTANYIIADYTISEGGGLPVSLSLVPSSSGLFSTMRPASSVCTTTRQVIQSPAPTTFALRASLLKPVACWVFPSTTTSSSPVPPIRRWLSGGSLNRDFIGRAHQACPPGTVPTHRIDEVVQVVRYVRRCSITQLNADFSQFPLVRHEMPGPRRIMAAVASGDRTNGEQPSLLKR